MKKRNKIKIALSLIDLVKPLTGYMILAITLGIIGHLTAVMIPILGGMALLDLIGRGVHITVRSIFIVIPILAVLRGILRYGEQYCNHFIAFKILALIRDKVFTSLRKLCPAKLDGKDKGNLISIITADIELLEVFYAHTISPIVIGFLMATFMTALIWHLSPILALIALAAYITIGMIIPLSTSRNSGSIGNELRNNSGELSAFILDSLRGLSEILQFGVGTNRLEDICSKTDNLSKIESQMKKKSGLNSAITQVSILSFDMIMIVAASILCVRGDISFSQALISIIVLMSSYGPFVSLSDLGMGLQNTFAAGNRVLDILDEEPAVSEIEGKNNCGFKGIEINNVSFSYSDEVILNNISLEISRNSVIGIQGKSGSGKSTLLKLLMRFWSVNKGEVRISNYNIEDINTKSLRDMQGFVTQETHLFQDSIINNLRVAKQDATQIEIEGACKKASIHDFITKLPKGYETPVGELGDTLSGGERQRIGLARAFLHDAPLLLLDEPTSNLDSLNEAIILKSISHERNNKTVVLVSHRASTMAITDKVYSAEYGRTS